jgi:hypothetical protein
MKPPKQHNLVYTIAEQKLSIRSAQNPGKSTLSECVEVFTGMPNVLHIRTADSTLVFAYESLLILPQKMPGETTRLHTFTGDIFVA